jgi:outer membrane protein assembly factor BamB
MAVGDAPLRWSETEGVTWKAAIPGRGHSSPVVWGDRIFLTTAVPTGNTGRAGATAGDAGEGARGAGRGRPGAALVEHRFLVQALDRRTGKPLWERVARTATPHEGHHFQYGSFASNSPITDGTHLYAFFGSRGLFAYTLDGAPVWHKDFPALEMYNTFGEGAWTALDGDRLFVVLDHQRDSFLLALDKNTGKELWRAPRQGQTNWSGPFVTTVNGRRQVIVSASREVVGYDAATGRRIWSATGLGQNTIPAPVVSGDVLIVMSGFRNPNLLAIRLGREGDLTGTDAILWQNQRGNSYTPSPVMHDGTFYMLTDTGMLSAFDARTGKAHYQQQRLPGTNNFKSSPVGASGKLYMASEEGNVFVVKMGPAFEVLATNAMGDETFIATPAIIDGGIYLRGRNMLYAIR